MAHSIQIVRAGDVGFGRRPLLRDSLPSCNSMSNSTGEEIIITKPGTEMMTAYRKASDRPNLTLNP